jgi:ABC-type transport system substrate-binding protein
MNLNKKMLFATIVSVASLIMALLPTNAWFYPGPAPWDDNLHNQFGPMTEHLQCSVYGGQPQEYAAFHACSIDVMDCALAPEQVMELNAIDPSMGTYARAFYVEHGMRQFDLNNMKFPTSNKYFRQAIAHCFDKTYFIANALAGLGLKMDSPLAWAPDWYNPVPIPYSLPLAVGTLIDHGYYDQDADGWVEGPSGEEIDLVMYCMADDPIRSTMGHILATTLTTELDDQNWAPHPAANIKVTEIHAPKSVCVQKVMVEFDYHIYTGDWSFGRDPTFLYELYRGDTAQAYPFTANYPGYVNPIFDEEGIASLNAPDMNTAKTHICHMQKLLGEDVGVIPVFTWTSYGAYKTGWEKVVNTEGVGPWGWFTFLNAHRPCYDIIKWGFINDIESLNPIYAYTREDWQILDKIYDTLINVNPYNMAEDKPWIAKEWIMGNWTYEGENATSITFLLEPNVRFHDGEYLTAEDIKFTLVNVTAMLAARGYSMPSWYSYVENIHHVDNIWIGPYPAVTVYMSVYMPLWALHSVGSVPILPKHIWEPILRTGDPYMVDPPVIGSGPFMFNSSSSVPHEYYILDANHRYFRFCPIYQSPSPSKWSGVIPGDILVIYLNATHLRVGATETITFNVKASLYNATWESEIFYVGTLAGTVSYGVLSEIGPFVWKISGVVAEGSYSLRVWSDHLPNIDGRVCEKIIPPTRAVCVFAASEITFNIGWPTQWIHQSPELAIEFIGFMLIHSVSYTGSVVAFPMFQGGGGFFLLLGQPPQEVLNVHINKGETITIPLFIAHPPKAPAIMLAWTIIIKAGWETHLLDVIMFPTSMQQCKNGASLWAGVTIIFRWRLGSPTAYLQAETRLPPGWSFSVNPPLNTTFETPCTVELNITAAQDAQEGDIGVVTLSAFDNNTGLLFWRFHFFAAVDTKPPTIDTISTTYNATTGNLTINASVTDLTTGVDPWNVTLFYSTNNSPWQNQTMEWVSGDTFNSTAYTLSMPVTEGSTVKFYINATDRIGKQTESEEHIVKATEIHDLAITNMTCQKTIVGTGYSMSTNVTLINQGDHAETFDITAYANTTTIQTKKVSLKSGTSEMIRFTWNTFGFPKGNYTMWAYAWPVSGETNTSDNTYSGGIVGVTMMGDCAPEFGIIDVFDLVYVALSFGAEYGKPPPPATQPYQPNADLNGDGIIDIFDLVTIALHYGEVDP